MGVDGAIALSPTAVAGVGVGGVVAGVSVGAFDGSMVGRVVIVSATVVWGNCCRLTLLLPPPVPDVGAGIVGVVGVVTGSVPVMVWVLMLFWAVLQMISM